MRRFLWLVVPLSLSLAFVTLQDQPLATQIMLLAAWIAASLHILVPLGTLTARLLRRSALLWQLILTVCMLALIGWLIAFQPAAGLPLSISEYTYWVAFGFILVAVLRVPVQERTQLSFWAGPLLTITTVAIIICGIELSLRYIWITSDNFAFSTMHHTWNRLHWQPINAQGYRDYAVLADDDPRTNIIVLGDSLAAGYGINDIAQTFPHLLAAELGPDYTANIVAEPGWGVATALALLQQEYPVEPDVLVLSHYINDIAEGPAGRNYGQAFPQIRIDPPQGQQWWIDNFFIANFLYYRVFLYTSNESIALYNNWITNAYSDPAVWGPYQDELQAVIDAATAYDAPLYVLVWPNLIDIAASEPITQPVIAFYEERGVPVVDMGMILSDDTSASLVVNRFDAHPSIYSHQRAAEALAARIRG